MTSVNPPLHADYPQNSPPTDAREMGILDIRPYNLGWVDRHLPPAILVQFDSRAFAISDFARHGIAIPPAIERSVPKRQAEFLMGRLAARHALTPLGAADREVPIGSSRAPLWPSGIVGSITHDHRFAAAIAVLTDNCTGIGIDIEHLIAPETQESIENTILIASEHALLERFSSKDPYVTLLTIVFSAKESFFKGTFATVGSYFDFHAVTLTGLDTINGTLELTIAQPLASTLPAGRRFPLRFDFIDAETLLTSFAW